MAKKKETCWDCGKERERCRAVSADEQGNVQWVCPQCYRDLEYEKYGHFVMKGQQTQ